MHIININFYKKILILLAIISNGNYLLMGQESDFNTMVDSLIENTVPTINSKTLFNQINYKVPMKLLDAREGIEYAVSHIENAILVGYKDFDIAEVENISKEEKIVVYCSLGYRSEKISEILNKNGYENVYNLYGGIFSWINQGYPIVSKEKKTRNIHPYDEEWGKWLEKGVKKYE